MRHRAAIVGMIIMFCACSLPARPVSEDAFRIVILNGGWDSLQLGYTSEKALSILSAQDATNAFFTISLTELESCDWDRQTYTLTGDATRQLVAALENKGIVDEKARGLLELEKSLGWGNPLESALYTRAFIVQLEGKTRYGGIFLNAISQMAIDYPVIRVSLVEGKAVLAILPVHIAFVTEDPVDDKSEMRDLSITPEAREDVASLDMKDGFMTDWITASATNSRTITQRELVRDLRIKEILLAAGKLK